MTCSVAFSGMVDTDQLDVYVDEELDHISDEELQLCSCSLLGVLNNLALNFD